MGATHITVTVRNPAEPHLAWEGVFRVAPDFIHCAAPRKELAAIGLVPAGQWTYIRADGSAIARDFAVAQVEFMGSVAGVNIGMVAEDDAEPLLGLTALESVGVEVDPASGTLKKKPHRRLPGFRPAADRPAADR